MRGFIIVMMRIYGVRTAVFFLLAAALFSFSACATITGISDTDDPSQPTMPADTSPYEAYIEGKPQHDMKTMGGFYIWKSGDNWSVRLARKMDVPRLVNVDPAITGYVRAENANIVSMKKQNLPFSSDAVMQRNQISFRSKLQNDIEGFDFRIQQTGRDFCVVFNVEVDGVPKPGITHLGAFMNNPDEMPVRVCFRPSHKK